DRAGAVRLVTQAVAGGMPLEDLYLDVLAPTLREVGRRWQVGEISIAQEHLATATTQLAIAQLYPQLFMSPRNGRSIVVASVGGDLHEVGARMLADLFELRGWESTFLGANTPVEELVALVVDTAPDVLAISATLPTHVEQVRASITALRDAGSDTIVLVGGRPFLQVTDLWRQVGADGTAPDARSAVEEATRLLRTKGRGDR
ncbi:MAG: B12-binding domain-containing protein, partial [Nitriliruptoraceae bacterium]